MLFIEFDLAGAEWVIVAYKANDPNMLEVVESGKSPHVVTGSLISRVSEELVEAENKLIGMETDPVKIAKLREQLPALHVGAPFLPRTMSIRQCGKKANHGLNYGMKHRKFALVNEIQEAEAAKIVEAYSGKAYKRLQNYWEDTRSQLRKDRTLTNCFGRKVRLLDEYGPDLLQAAYAFVPQSTVADCVNQALRLAYNDVRPEFQFAHPCVQVHDSLLFAHESKDPEVLLQFCASMTEHMRPMLCYSGEEFQLEVDVKVGTNWGKMQTFPRKASEAQVRELFVAAVAASKQARCP